MKEIENAFIIVCKKLIYPSIRICRGIREMKLRLRQYKPCDADSIVSWIKDEEALRKWSSDRFGDFPITSEDINNKYIEKTVIVLSVIIFIL